MNRIKIFLSNIRHSWLFSLVLMCEVVVCICLFAIASTSTTAVRGWSDYLNLNTASKSLVAFDGYDDINDTSYGTLSKMTDMSGLATTVELRDVNEDAVFSGINIATPALADNFDDMGFKFSGDVSSDYREAYASSSQTDYEINKFYDISATDGIDIYSVRVKIIGIREPNSKYYGFSTFKPLNEIVQPILEESIHGILICDNLPEFAKVESGIMINDIAPSHYNDLGFQAITVKEYYDSKTSDEFDILMYLAICCIIFAAASILCNYVLNIDNITKRSAVMYVCGETKASVVCMEAVKMVSIFSVGMAISYGITHLIISTTASNQDAIVTWAKFYQSVGVILGVYLLSVLIGFVKFARINPLKVIGNENVD